MEGWWIGSYVVLWAVVLLQVVMILGLAREIGTMRLHAGDPGALSADMGLELGSTAPDFTATEVPGGQVIRYQGRAPGNRPILLTFVSPDCTPCRDLLPSFARGWNAWRRRVQVYVVCKGGVEEVEALMGQAGLRIPLLADPEAGIRQAYGNPPTPFAYLIDEGGAIKLKGIVNTRDDIERLIQGQAYLPNAVVTASEWAQDAGLATPIGFRSEESIHGQAD
jgi:methylamine dehydrogenase accessory protein MauD